MELYIKGAFHLLELAGQTGQFVKRMCQFKGFNPKVLSQCFEFFFKIARTIFGVIVFFLMLHHPFKITHSIYRLAGQFWQVEIALMWLNVINSINFDLYIESQFY